MSLLLALRSESVNRRKESPWKSHGGRAKRKTTRGSQDLLRVFLGVVRITCSSDLNEDIGQLGTSDLRKRLPKLVRKLFQYC